MKAKNETIVTLYPGHKLLLKADENP